MHKRSKNVDLTFGARRTTLNSEGFHVPQRSIRPTHPAKNEQGEFGNFTRLLDKLLSVPHSKIKAELDAEKRRKRTSRKRAASGHAFSDTD
jgi:hypothetical protein